MTGPLREGHTDRALSSPSDYEAVILLILSSYNIRQTELFYSLPIVPLSEDSYNEVLVRLSGNDSVTLTL